MAGLPRQNPNDYVPQIAALLKQVYEGHGEILEVEQFDDFKMDAQITQVTIRQSRSSIHRAQDRFVQSMAGVAPAIELFASASAVSAANAAYQMQLLMDALAKAKPGKLPDIFSPLVEELGTAEELIVGYRDFYFKDDLWVLSSRNRVEWPERKPLKARCTLTSGRWQEHPREDAPIERCTCGIYAYDTPRHKDMKAEAKIWGEVYLWGSTYICETGYRAEYAYPKSFFMLQDGTRKKKGMARMLEEDYGVPVYLVENRDGLTETEHIAKMWEMMAVGSDGL